MVASLFRKIGVAGVIALLLAAGCKKQSTPAEKTGEANAGAFLAEGPAGRVLHFKVAGQERSLELNGGEEATVLSLSMKKIRAIEEKGLVLAGFNSAGKITSLSDKALPTSCVWAALQPEMVELLTSKTLLVVDPSGQNTFAKDVVQFQICPQEKGGIQLRDEAAAQALQRYLVQEGQLAAEGLALGVKDLSGAVAESRGAGVAAKLRRVVGDNRVLDHVDSVRVGTPLNTGRLSRTPSELDSVRVGSSLGTLNDTGAGGASVRGSTPNDSVKYASDFDADSVIVETPPGSVKYAGSEFDSVRVGTPPASVKYAGSEGDSVRVGTPSESDALSSSANSASGRTASSDYGAFRSSDSFTSIAESSDPLLQRFVPPFQRGAALETLLAPNAQAQVLLKQGEAGVLLGKGAFATVSAFRLEGVDVVLREVAPPPVEKLDRAIPALKREVAAYSAQNAFARIEGDRTFTPTYLVDLDADGKLTMVLPKMDSFVGKLESKDAPPSDAMLKTWAEDLERQLDTYHRGVPTTFAGKSYTMTLFHRDIKPENILLGSNGRPVFSDFGTGLIVLHRQLPGGKTEYKVLDYGPDGKAVLEDLSQKHIKREVVGTPSYMSPDYINGSQTISAATPGKDIFQMFVDADVHAFNVTQSAMKSRIARPPEALIGKDASGRYNPFGTMFLIGQMRDKYPLRGKTAVLPWETFKGTAEDVGPIFSGVPVK